MSQKDFTDKIQLLEFLLNEEKSLKIKLQYEKIKKEEEIFLDSEAVIKGIERYGKVLDKLQSEHKVKKMMQRNAQIADTVQKIQSKSKNKSEEEEMSFRSQVSDLMRKKKELTKRIRIEQNEIYKLEEDATYNLEKKMEECSVNDQHPPQSTYFPDQTQEKLIFDIETCTNINVIKEKSQKIHHRTKLLSQVLYKLTSNLEVEGHVQLIPFLEDISNSKYTNLEDLRKILQELKSMDSVND